MQFIENSELTARIEAAIAQLRPFFEADSGDIRLVGIDNDYIARVELIGACKTCSLRDNTIKAGIEEAVKKVAPEIKAVEPLE